MFGKKLGEDLIEKVLSKQNPQPKITLRSTNFFWTIENVNYNNGIYQVDLLKDFFGLSEKELNLIIADKISNGAQIKNFFNLS